MSTLEFFIPTNGWPARIILVCQVITGLPASSICNRQFVSDCNGPSWSHQNQCQRVQYHTGSWCGLTNLVDLGFTLNHILLSLWVFSYWKYSSEKIYTKHNILTGEFPLALAWYEFILEKKKAKATNTVSGHVITFYMTTQSDSTFPTAKSRWNLLRPQRMV